jgi:signal peptidase I
VVVFRRREEGDRNYIKRVVGLPGERVAVVGGEVRINGRPLRQTPAPEHGEGAFWEGDGRHRYLVRRGPTPDAPADTPEVLLPDDRVFLLGDHRSASRDSRTWGPVPLADLVGPATYVLWPADTWSRFGPVR